MKVTEVAPSERFKNVSFSSAVVDGGALPLHARYTCPRCAEVIAFTKDHFEVRAERRHTNLSTTVLSDIVKWETQRGFGDAAFLDWACPGCQLMVRAYVQRWAGGRHGDHGANIVAVIELG